MKAWTKSCFGLSSKLRSLAGLRFDLRRRPHYAFAAIKATAATRTRMRAWRTHTHAPASLWHSSDVLHIVLLYIVQVVYNVFAALHATLGEMERCVAQHTDTGDWVTAAALWNWRDTDRELFLKQVTAGLPVREERRTPAARRAVARRGDRKAEHAVKRALAACGRHIASQLTAGLLGADDRWACSLAA